MTNPDRPPALTPEESAATTPLYAAEQISQEHLLAYYTRRRRPNRPENIGYFALEEGLRSGDPSLFDAAMENLTIARNGAVAAKRLRAGAILDKILICMPAYRDRGTQGSVTSESARAVYKSASTLLERVASMNDPHADGLQGEIIIIALGARAAIRDPGAFIYPTVPRESGERPEANSNILGQLVNHDAAIVHPEGFKDPPIEVKLQPPVARRSSDVAYDPRVAVISIKDILHRAGYIDTPTDQRDEAGVRQGMQRIIDAIRQEVAEGVNRDDLDSLGRALNDCIQDHRRDHPVHTIVDPPIDRRNNSTRPDGQTGNQEARIYPAVSIGAVVTGVEIAYNTAQEAYDNIKTAVDKLKLGREMLNVIAGGADKSGMSEITGLLQPGDSSLKKALEDIEASMREINTWLRAIGSERQIQA